MKLAIAFAFSFTLIGLVLWSTTESTVVPIALSITEDESNAAIPTIETELKSIAPPEVDATTGREEVWQAEGTDGQNSPDEMLGRLSLLYVDAETGEPIPGLRFAAYTEQPKQTLLERGTTNADGRAYIEKIAEKLVLIETVREPPYAVSMVAAWLADKPRQSLTVQVSKGGSVTGRVVNDHEQPVEDVAVFFSDASRASAYWRTKGYDPAPIAWSDSNGEYRFDAVVSTAQGVWLEKDELRPENWNAVGLRVKEANQYKQALVDDGAEVRVPDFIVNRSVTYVGFVTDFEGNLVAEALVSANTTRRNAAEHSGYATKANRSRPGQPDFELLKNETLTDANGQFELKLQTSPGALHVWAKQHALEKFSVDRLGPGSRSKRIELRLNNRQTLEFELVDAEEKRIEEANSFEDGFSYSLFANSQHNSGTFEFSFRLNDGSWRRIKASPEADGLIRFSVDFAVDQIEQLLINVTGYSLSDTLPPTFSSTNGPVRIQLERLPEIKIKLNLPELNNDEQLHNIGLHACTLDRAARLERIANAELVCCGLGTFAHFYRKDPDQKSIFGIPVLEVRSYEIFAIRQSDDSAPPVIFGPFYPGDQLHQITLDRSFIRERKEKAKEPEEDKAAPPPSKPSDFEKVDNVFFRVVDASTGDLIPRVGLKVFQTEASRGWYQSATQSNQSGGGSAQLPDGHWPIHISAAGFRNSNELQVSIAGSREVRLGTIELQPHPTLTVQFRNPDDSKLAENSFAYVNFTTDEGLEKRRYAHLGSDGRFSLKQPLPQKLFIELTVPNDGHRAIQSWSLEKWNEDTVETLTLSNWTELSVRFQIPVDYRYSPVRLKVFSLDPSKPHPSSADTDSTRQKLFGTTAQEDPPSSDGARVFRARIGPGLYLVQATSALLNIEPETIEIKADVETKSVELTATL
ncbi:MAG: hypothetical protein ACI8TQ_003237 [Planctomycetota bacterium]|jgi:hypothetical protein